MEHPKISELLNDLIVSGSVTRKWIKVIFNKVSDFWDEYSVNKNVRFKTPMLKSDLWDYSYTYITVKGTTDLLVDAANENAKV